MLTDFLYFYFVTTDELVANIFEIVFFRPLQEFPQFSNNDYRRIATTEQTQVFIII